MIYGTFEIRVLADDMVVLLLHRLNPAGHVIFISLFFFLFGSGGIIPAPTHLDSAVMMFGVEGAYRSTMTSFPLPPPHTPPIHRGSCQLPLM